MVFLDVVVERLISLVQAPLNNETMLWTAIPLLIATLFITLYFGKYSKEELGWNTAFGNTMVFLFVSLDILRYIYYSDGTGSINNLFSNAFYSSITLALVGVAFVLMIITYYHLLPKKVAFFLFSAPPVNVSVYVLMTIVYNQAPADAMTLTAAVILFVIIFAFLKGLQSIEHMAGKPDGITLEAEGTPEDKLLNKFKERNKQMVDVKKKIQEGEF